MRGGLYFALGGELEVARAAGGRIDELGLEVLSVDVAGAATAQVQFGGDAVEFEIARASGDDAKFGCLEIEVNIARAETAKTENFAREARASEIARAEGAGAVQHREGDFGRAALVAVEVDAKFGVEDEDIVFYAAADVALEIFVAANQHLPFVALFEVDVEEAVGLHGVEARELHRAGGHFTGTEFDVDKAARQAAQRQESKGVLKKTAKWHDAGETPELVKSVTVDSAPGDPGWQTSMGPCLRDSGGPQQRDKRAPAPSLASVVCTCRSAVHFFMLR